MTRLFLLRHGATAANRSQPYRLQGRHSDLPLDPLGIEQSRRAANVLATCALAAVYSSPLARSLQTARLVSEPHQLTPIAVEGLIEANVGRWEGLTWSEVEAADPDAYARFLADPGAVPYLGGESFLDVQRRAVPTINALVAQHPNQSIAVIGHNVVNRAYLAPLLGLPIDRARGLRQANGGINVILFTDRSPLLSTFNSDLHLEGLD